MVNITRGWIHVGDERFSKWILIGIMKILTSNAMEPEEITKI